MWNSELHSLLQELDIHSQSIDSHECIYSAARAALLVVVSARAFPPTTEIGQIAWRQLEKRATDKKVENFIEDAAAVLELPSVDFSIAIRKLEELAFDRTRAELQTLASERDAEVRVLNRRVGALIEQMERNRAQGCQQSFEDARTI